LDLQRECAVTDLRVECRDVFVILHNEDVARLSNALKAEGFEVREVRGPYASEMAGWSPNTLCLVNHRNAWRLIAEGDRASIVVEADFVPVRGFGGLSVPCELSDGREALAYLYVCGPQLWDLVGGLRGHGGGGVAYVVSPQMARRLIEFADSEILATTPEKYMGWDSRVGFWLNQRGIQTYLPYRNYGEHGGHSNPEHHQAGLRRHHRADLLAAPLAFPPIYARESRLRFAWIRLCARSWGIARLLAGRYLAWNDFWRSDEKLRLLRIAVGRHLFRSPASGSTGAP
jgi:hypothetical protein